MKEQSIELHPSQIIPSKEIYVQEQQIEKTFDEKVISLLTNAFLNNPRMFSLIGKNAMNFAKKVGMILHYTYTLAKRINGVFFSTNEKTVMLYYRKSDFRHNFQDYRNYLKIALFCVPPSNLLSALRREKKIASLREKKEDYLYVWFLAQEETYDKLDGLREAKIFLLNKAKELNLPILVETTEKRLLILYRRLGFDIYRSWEDEKTGMKVWFAKKEIS